MHRLLILLVLFFFGWVLHAQHQDKVDFTYADAYISVMPSEKKLAGTVTYRFKVLNDVDSVFLDAKNMKFGYVSLNDEVTDFERTDERIIFRREFKANQSYTLGIGFEAQPQQTVYFVSTNGIPSAVKELGDPNLQRILVNQQIWTQGQGKYTSHWLPSFDAMEEKVEFDLTINTDIKFEVIANGKLLEKDLDGKGKLNWNFDMEKPMSSYLLAFVIGNYEKETLKSKSGITIENYFYPKDSLKVEPTYRYTKEIFDFLEAEIDFAYPWQNYKQIPVHDFLYAGMENTTATVFSDGYVIDSTAFVDKNYVNVNAHEMAHQWFGNLVTETDGNHHWLHEGFATYYAYLAEQHLFGDDHFYWKLYESLRLLEDQTKKGEGQSLLDPKASSLTFYEKGAWALFMLRNEVGDKAFKKGIKKYLKKFQFKNVTVDDFLEEMEAASKLNLSQFKKDWLENKDFPLERAKKLLNEKSPSIKLLSDLEAELAASQSDDIDYQKYWDLTNSIHLKKHILLNYERSLLFDSMRKAMESDTIPIHQALLKAAPSSDFLPKEYLINFLLEDSYVSNELALIQLWQGYPEERAKYLTLTKDITGLPNKNVRLLWLLLAIVTEDYEAMNTQAYFKELSGYTSAGYGWEIRMGAFQYLREIGFTDESLKNMINAAVHHSWQFKKFARNLIDELVEDADYKNRINNLLDELQDNELRYIKTKLN